MLTKEFVSCAQRKTINTMLHQTVFLALITQFLTFSIGSPGSASSRIKEAKTRKQLHHVSLKNANSQILTIYSLNNTRIRMIFSVSEIRHDRSSS
jgi:hypothetical protein